MPLWLSINCEKTCLTQFKVTNMTFDSVVGLLGSKNNKLCEIYDPKSLTLCDNYKLNWILLINRLVCCLNKNVRVQ